MSTPVDRHTHDDRDVPAEPAQEAAPPPPPPPPPPTAAPRAPRTPGVLLRAVLATAASAPSAAGTAPPSAPPGSGASEVLPRLYISDVFTALNPAALRALRITHIISVMEHLLAFPARPALAPVLSPVTSSSSTHASQLDPPPTPPPPTPPPALKTLHIPLPDLPSADIVSHFHTTRAFIDAALRDENARVLVHCYQGVSRSPTIVAAYLISTRKLSTDDALSRIRATRPAVLPNRGFRRQLEQYAEVVRGEDDMICSEK